MPIDLSLFKNIDFTNNDNFLFVAIFAVISIIVFFIIFFVIEKILKIIKKIIIRLFNIDVKKPKFNKKESTDWLHQSQNDEQFKESKNIPKQSVGGGDFNANFKAGSKPDKKEETAESYKEKEAKEIAEGLSKLKADGSAGEGALESKMPSRTESPESEEKDKNKEIKIPRPKVHGGDFVEKSNSNINTKEVKGDAKETKGDNENLEKNKVQLHKEKEAKEIAEGLSKLKAKSSGSKDTLESKMPSRTESPEEEDKYKEIKIPTSSILHGQPLVYEKDKIEAARETSQKQDQGLVGDILGGKEIDKVLGPKLEQDSSIFAGQKEVSRIKLKNEMRTDAKVWRAAKQTGLNMSPVERAKLVKEVFSSALGTNISKTDLKISVKKLNRKMLDSKNSEEHAKLRKEIKFFKKIGGIK